MAVTGNAAVRGRARLIALALACAAGAPAAAAGDVGTEKARAITATASTDELPLGGSLSVSGSAAPSATVLLQWSPYPYRSYRTISSATSGADGEFSFARVRPERNTRLRVVLSSSPPVASAAMSVVVDPVVALHSQSLGPGAIRLSMSVRHTRSGAGGSVTASWFLAVRGSRIFRLAAVTATREVAAGVTYASTIVNPPSRRFTFRVCLNPAWETAMGRPGAHGRCPAHDFLLASHAR
jgi:hypothetical protein